MGPDLVIAEGEQLRQQVDNRLLTWQLATRRAAIAAAIGLACALYLADLTGMGMVTPDEPRYAAIGRAMAHSGDWVTPRLWGDPWFEKPALLYWMTASAFKLGLSPDLAPRLPVALLSLAFLAFFWWRLRIEWSPQVASCSTAMLAASAGWLAYSHVAVTDLPLAAFFSAAVMLSMPWIARQERQLLPVAAACLGLATMAKQLVPLVLFLPILAIGWRRWRDWLRPAPLVAFAVCALPWYILCTLRNGSEAPRVLFIQQTFSRFNSAALQHVQPWWFYFPILLLLLYPWFPLLVLFPARPARDPRLRALVAIVVFGFVFFSASLNKLPGYLLPLMPAVFRAYRNRPLSGETAGGPDGRAGRTHRIVALYFPDCAGRPCPRIPVGTNSLAGAIVLADSRGNSIYIRGKIRGERLPRVRPLLWPGWDSCGFRSPLFPASTRRPPHVPCGSQATRNVLPT